MRLDKFLADMGAGSRSEIRKNIRRNGAEVDGKRYTDPAQNLDENSITRILYQGETYVYEPIVWYMLNKPAGVLSASQDDKQPTVLDLIPGKRRTGLFPVGRLDKDSEGLLLITNDGVIAHKLLSPRFHVEKKYYVRTRGAAFTQKDIRSFREGIQYDSSLQALPADMEILSDHEALVAIQEGKFHQIKKMIAALDGHKEVIYLKRVSFGPLVLDETLQPGESRRLTDAEIARLEESTHVSHKEDST